MVHLPPTADDAAEEQPRLRLSRPLTVSIIGIFIILTAGAMYYARGFFLPLVLAVVVTLTFAPLVRMLSHRGIPSAASAVLLILVLGGGIGLAGVLLADPVARVVTQAPNVVKEVRERFAFLREPFAQLNQATQEVQSLTEDAGAANDPERVVVVQQGLLSWAAGTAADAATTLGATLLLSVFLLGSSEQLRLKVIRPLPSLSGKKRSLRVLRDIENEVSRYLLTITAINLGLGVAVGLAMAALGMPNPLIWGIAAALLNYIPYLGGLAAVLATAAIAAITYPTLAAAAGPPLAYLAIALIESNVVTPMVLGRRLELNTVAILIFLSLTTWMWGIVGTIIGVPLLVVVKVFCDNFTMLAPLGNFLSAETPATVEEEDEPVAPPSIIPATRQGDPT